MGAADFSIAPANNNKTVANSAEMLDAFADLLGALETSKFEFIGVDRQFLADCGRDPSTGHRKEQPD